MRIRIRLTRRPSGPRFAPVLFTSVILGVAVAGTAGFGLAGGSSSVTGPGGGEWTTYGGNFQRSAEQPRSPVLQPLRLLWRTSSVDGAVYGEPLIYQGRVYVGTEADIVDAFDAGSGRLLWTRRIGQPVSAGHLPCGDIGPTVGITSTMVIDPLSDDLYASEEVAAGVSVHHELVALDAASGRVLFRRDLDQVGWSGAAQLQRAALALDDRRVLIGFGGNDGDCGSYQGYLMSVPENGSGATLVYAVPTTKGGAIWAPAGVSVLPSGEILAATGNGASTTNYDEGDSILGLTPRLKLVGYFAPSTWRLDNADDLDLGSTAPVALSDGRVLIVGKSGGAYLLNSNHLGGVGGQVASTEVCNARGGNAVDGSYVFVACPDSSLTALRVQGNSLTVVWHAPQGVSGSPTVAGGDVWSVSGGELVGLNPRTGAQVVTVAAVPTEHFAAPSAGEGLLVVGGDGAVEAFAGPAGYRL
ncbi:MAG TPA: PQQ-binding-like beta-propeller repeat protein [Acidimicrobiales bacterium]|nr:PQQ-binding-like beta-propeller repeat protein [Acidimicrobiales bacterium]